MGRTLRWARLGWSDLVEGAPGVSFPHRVEMCTALVRGPVGRRFPSHSLGPTPRTTGRGAEAGDAQLCLGRGEFERPVSNKPVDYEWRYRGKAWRIRRGQRHVG